MFKKHPEISTAAFCAEDPEARSVNLRMLYEVHPLPLHAAHLAFSPVAFV